MFYWSFDTAVYDWAGVALYQVVFVTVKSKTQCGPSGRVTDLLNQGADEIYTIFLYKHVALGPAGKKANQI